MDMEVKGNTVIEVLSESLDSAAKFNPNDVVRPSVVLWTDHDSQWLPIIPQLRQLMPHLLVLGAYEHKQRTGPAIWLRCVVDRALSEPEVPDGKTPIIYMPGISRQELRAVQECPENLKPLVELQYRGVSWTQKNGKDWTVEAFLVSEDGGLGLDVARDARTRSAMLGALTELATTSVTRLVGKRLEAEDFDKLFSGDLERDLLVWMSEPDGTKSSWGEERWKAFRSRCKAELGFDPEKDGELVAAERLGKREDPWGLVWDRFAESPALYPGVTELLRKAMPSDLFVEPSSWPQNNEDQENALRKSLLEFENVTPAEAREKVLSLEAAHGERRSWIWAKLGQAPLAIALEHLAAVAKGTAAKFGGATVEDMGNLYAKDAWKTDAAALFAMASVKSSADAQAITKALGAIYGPWLESAAEHLQKLAEKDPLPCRNGQEKDDLKVDSGGLLLFADGLRFDVAQLLCDRMRARGLSVRLSKRWAGLPTVTATAKPAVSPVAAEIKGITLGENFLPATSVTEQPLTTDRFRKLLAAAGYEYLRADETGDPAGRAWTENGELDKLGHSLQAKLADKIEDQIELLLERIETLLDAGWREICVVTDHGWLWLPSGLPKVDLPKYLTASRWARCAAIKGGSKVKVPTAPWYWNPHEQVAMGPGISCFGAGNEYAHGGLSLQEALIPVIRVTAGTGKMKTAVKVTSVSWAGLRCRVRIEPAAAGLTVDLRTKVNDADSSVTTPRSVDDEGEASLLIADDELEGISVTVVVLDAAGHVITKQPTIIGGED